MKRLNAFRSSRAVDAPAPGSGADLDDDGQRDFNEADVTDDEVEGSDGPPVVASDLESGDELISDDDGGGGAGTDAQEGPDCTAAAPLGVGRTLTPLGRLLAVLLLLLVAFAVVRLAVSRWTPAAEPAVDAGPGHADQPALAARPLAAIARPAVQRTVNAMLLPMVGVRAAGRVAAYATGCTLRGIARGAVLLGRGFLTAGGAAISLPRVLIPSWSARTRAPAGDEAAAAATVWVLEDRVSRLAEACANKESVEHAVATAAAAKRLASEAQERAAEEALHQAVTRAVADAEERLRVTGAGTGAGATKAAVQKLEEHLEALRTRVIQLESRDGAQGEDEVQAAAAAAAAERAAQAAAQRAEEAGAQAMQASEAAERAAQSASARAEGVETAASRAEAAATSAATSAEAAAKAVGSLETAPTGATDVHGVSVTAEDAGRDEAQAVVREAIERCVRRRPHSHHTLTSEPGAARGVTARRASGAALSRYAADKVGRVDYAAVMAGAQVVTACVPQPEAAGGDPWGSHPL